MRSSNVFPRLAKDDMTDCIWSYTKDSSNIFLRDAHIGLLSYFDNICFCQLSHDVSGSFSSTRSNTSLPDTISYIFLRGPRKKMFRIAAGRIIADNMSNIQPFWDRAMGQEPGHAMCTPCFPIWHSELTIPSGPSGATPWPTSIWSSRLVDIAPKCRRNVCSDATCGVTDAIAELAMLRGERRELFPTMWATNDNGHAPPKRVRPRGLVGSCQGNQHIRLWGRQIKNPTHAVDPLDAFSIAQLNSKVNAGGAWI